MIEYIAFIYNVTIVRLQKIILNFETGKLCYCYKLHEILVEILEKPKRASFFSEFGSTSGYLTFLSCKLSGYEEKFLMVK